MHSAIRDIEQAIQKIYNLDLCCRVEDFLIPFDPSKLSSPLASVAAGKSQTDFRGALLVQLEERENSDPDLNLGVYLSKALQEQLSTLQACQASLWSRTQMDAFGVAAEEISHFHYLVYHANEGRGVSQLELEIQGEIDKFLLLFFAKVQGKRIEESVFESVFELSFEAFTLRNQLTHLQKDRYLEASRLAKRFIAKQRINLGKRERLERAFSLLRKFYRLDISGKLSCIGT